MGRLRFRRGERARQRGMTLIEVVVAMLVIGLGLVMSISMLQSSLRYQAMANRQDDAMRLMQEMVDRMRANSIAANNYLFSQHNFAFNAWRPPQIAAKCSGNGCSPARNLAFARAQRDVNDWLAEVGTVLPAGRAAIDQPNRQNLPNQYRIQLQWLVRQDRSRQAESNAQFNAAQIPPPERMEIVFIL